MPPPAYFAQLLLPVLEVKLIGFLVAFPADAETG